MNKKRKLMEQLARLMEEEKEDQDRNTVEVVVVFLCMFWRGNRLYHRLDNSKVTHRYQLY